MSLLRVWSLKRGSQSLAHAPRAALALLFLTHLLFSRLGARTPRPVLHTSSATGRARTSSDSNGGRFSCNHEHPTTEACAFEKAHPHVSSALSLASYLSALSFFSPLLYHQLVSCIGLRLSSSPARTHRDVRTHGHSGSAPRRRCTDRVSPRSTSSSTSINFISAPFPSLIFASATRVRLGTSHTHQTKHGGASGVLQPGGNSFSGEEESDADEDTVLTEEDQAEEEECAAQIAIQETLEGDFAGTSDSLMSTSLQWIKLKEVLMRRMNNKEACAASVGSEPVCRVIPAEDSGGAEVGGRNLPCGGERYERLVEQFLDQRNCMAAMVMSHTLSQGWLGLPHTDEAAAAAGGVTETSITAQPVGDKAEHTRALAAKGGLLGILVKQYEQVMESGVLDSELSSVYSAAAQLLSDFRSAAVDGLNAFNSLELRDALLVRREQQVAILCSLGEGKKADLGSNVLATDNALVVRVNTEGHDQATAKAFIDAVTAFGRFIKALLEESGLADRAIEVHKDFYKFRFSKMQALMQNLEPNVLVHTSNALLNALPLEKHKKHKHKKHKSSTSAGQDGTQGGDSGGGDVSFGGSGAASFPQLSATEAKDFLPITFLQLVAEQNEAFKQQMTGLLHLANGTVKSREDLPPSFLQSTADLQTSQLQPVSAYGTPPPSPPPQPAAVFVSQPIPVMVGPSPAGGAATTMEALPQVNPQPPVAALIGPAQSPGMQQPFSGQVGQQQLSAGGSLGNQLTSLQPFSPTPVAMGPSQQQPQQLQQQQQQAAPAAAQPPLRQQQPELTTAQPWDTVYVQQPIQMGQPVQQQGQQAQQQQGQPLQQQQQVRPPLQQLQQVREPLQQPQQVGQPLQQPQQVGQPLQQQQQVGQPLQQQQQVGQPVQAQGQGMPQMQPHETAPGTQRFPQGGASQNVEGGAANAEGKGGERGREESHTSQRQRQGPGGGQGEFSPRAFTEKGVPLKQKLRAVVSRLRMFKMQEDKVLFEADEALVDKIVRAGYHELNDRVYTVWGALLPQAAVTTAAELLTMLMPIPEVDLAMFYNKTLHDGGRITDGYSGPLPIDDQAIIQRFSRFVDETYSECWRYFFARNDNLMEVSSPPPFPAQQPAASASHPSVSFSALQVEDGHLSLAAETEEATDYLHHTAQAAETLQQQRHHEYRKGQGDVRGSVLRALAPASKRPLNLVVGSPVLAQVQQHAKVSPGGGHGAIQGKPRMSVTFVESSDGVQVGDLQKQFVNMEAVESRTVKALQSGAPRTLSWTTLPAAASVAMALLSTIFLVEF